MVIVDLFCGLVTRDLEVFRTYEDADVANVAYYDVHHFIFDADGTYYSPCW